MYPAFSTAIRGTKPCELDRRHRRAKVAEPAGNQGLLGGRTKRTAILVSRPSKSYCRCRAPFPAEYREAALESDQNRRPDFTCVDLACGKNMHRAPIGFGCAPSCPAQRRTISHCCDSPTAAGTSRRGERVNRCRSVPPRMLRDGARHQVRRDRAAAQADDRTGSAPPPWRSRLSETGANRARQTKWATTAGTCHQRGPASGHGKRFATVTKFCSIGAASRVRVRVISGENRQ